GGLPLPREVGPLPVGPLKVSGPTDTGNFDTYPRTCEFPEDEESGWDKDF
ncbi:hypothetical protein CDAR_504751, partial [Caerostris darwini]